MEELNNKEWVKMDGNRKGRLYRDIKKDLDRLRNNIDKTTEASEATMLKRLDEIQANIVEVNKCMEEEHDQEIARLKEELYDKDKYIDELLQLKDEALDIYRLYTALMNTYCYGELPEEIQRVKSIGYIVANFAAKGTKVEVEEWKDI